jgi:hypothetical protein
MAKGKLAGGLFKAGEGAAAVARVAAHGGKEGPTPESRRTVTTTIRLRPDHWEALRLASMKETGPGKRADSSAMLEKVLDAWVKGRK